MAHTAKQHFSINKRDSKYRQSITDQPPDSPASNYLPLDYISPRSIGSTRPIPSNGHCPKSSNGVHYWNIATPTGPISIGVCRCCGEKKNFYNYINVGFNDRESSVSVGGMPKTKRAKKQSNEYSEEISINDI